MAENQSPKSKRDQYVERLKNKYPDRKYADDEALFGQINDDYDDYEKQIGDYKGREDQLTNMFAKDPRSAQFIADMANGKDPIIGMLEAIGIDGMTDLINNPEKQSEYAEANKKFMERLSKEKSLEEEYESNLAESMRQLEQIQQERGLSDENVDAAMDMILHIASEAILGKFSPETIDLALKATGYDAAVDNARTEGQIAGRNQKIDEQLRKPKSGDGMPVMGGTSGGNRGSGQKESLFDVARGAQ